MNFIQTLHCNVKLQFRHGFYGIYGIIIIIYVVLLRLIPMEYRGRALAVLVFTDPMVFGFYFVNVMLFMERRQGVLDTLFVTPLSAETYLASKMLSMALLSIFGGLGVIISLTGFDFILIPALCAILLTACFSTLAGFIIGSRFSDFFVFMGIGSLFLIPAALPVFRLLGLPDHFLYRLLPGMPFLMLFEAIFVGLEPGDLLYAVFGSLLLTALSYPWAASALRRHVISGIGG